MFGFSYFYGISKTMVQS